MREPKVGSANMEFAGPKAGGGGIGFGSTPVYPEYTEGAVTAEAGSARLKSKKHRNRLKGIAMLVRIFMMCASCR